MGTPSAATLVLTMQPGQIIETVLSRMIPWYSPLLPLLPCYWPAGCRRSYGQQGRIYQDGHSLCGDTCADRAAWADCGDRYSK
jgi:hypothetical protein